MKLEDLNPTLRKLTGFWAKLLVLGLLFQGVLYLDPSTKPLQELLAWYLSVPLSYLGFDITLQNYSIYIEDIEYLITRDCLGWKSVALFLSLVLASTHKPKQLKFILPTGILVIIAANNARILSTIILAELGVISWEIIHSFLWRWGLAAVVLVTWFAWIRRTDVL